MCHVSRAPAPRATAPRWLDDAQMRAWRAYVATVTDLNAALEADLAAAGFTLGDYQVLVYLSEAEERRMRMCDLAAELHLSPSGLTRRLDGLVKAGYVSREGSESDRRVMLAVLTPRGWAALEAAAPLHAESVQRRIFDQLDPADVAAMERIFTAIGGAMCPSRQTPPA